MRGLGTIINSAAIIAGGLVGHFTGRFFQEDQQDALTKTCGVSVLFIAIAGAMQGMLHIDGGRILSGRSMLVVLCLAFGTFIGEIIGIEKGFVLFGEWLKMKLYLRHPGYLEGDTNEHFEGRHTPSVSFGR